jgi:hypothetical protein
VKEGDARMRKRNWGLGSISSVYESWVLAGVIRIELVAAEGAENVKNLWCVSHEEAFGRVGGGR